MKSCSLCKQEKELSEFNKKGSSYQPYCKPCDRQKSRERYANNREHHIKVIGERNQKLRKELSDWIKEIKESSPCMDCNVFYPSYVMDFDHVHGDKVENISVLVNSAAKKKLIEELKKCELVCSNCHRIRTHSGR